MINFDHSTNDISASSGSVTINGLSPLAANTIITSISGVSAATTGLLKLTNGVASLDTGSYLTSGSALGTPVSGTLTNCAGLPIATGVSGLATGAATFLATPTSAYLAALTTDETGTGNLVFNTSPSIVTPTITGTKEVKVVLTANSIDLATGNCFTKTITAATTFTLANIAAAGSLGSFILDLTNGGAFTITWWSGIKWAGGTIPTLTSVGRDSLGFFTHDGGTTWTGIILGKDFK